MRRAGILKSADVRSCPAVRRLLLVFRRRQRAAARRAGRRCALLRRTRTPAFWAWASRTAGRGGWCGSPSSAGRQAAGRPYRVTTDRRGRSAHNPRRRWPSVRCLTPSVFRKNPRHESAGSTQLGSPPYFDRFARAGRRGAYGLGVPGHAGACWQPYFNVPGRLPAGRQLPHPLHPRAMRLDELTCSR